MKQISNIVIITVVVCCLMMGFVDGILSPPYAIKSAIKAILFFLLPAVLIYTCKLPKVQVFALRKKAILTGLAMGILTFVLIVGLYAGIGNHLDLQGIPAALESNGGITKDNFLFVGLYIAFCNSFLEEFFFRGFAFLSLKRTTNLTLSHCFSAGAFALYHCAFMGGWFSPALFALTVVALFVCGLLFNYLNQKHECMWTSWLLHLFANLGINTIGMHLLGML